MKTNCRYYNLSKIKNVYCELKGETADAKNRITYIRNVRKKVVAQAELRGKNAQPLLRYKVLSSASTIYVHQVYIQEMRPYS
jgi:hypothetical protein